MKWLCRAKKKKQVSHTIDGAQRLNSGTRGSCGGRAWIAMLGTNLNGGTMEDRYFPHEFEVWQGDEMVASASGPREDALREAMHYAAQYAEDGPVRVFEVTRTLVPNAKVSEGENER